METAYAGVTSPEAALEFLMLAQDRVGNDLTSFELMARIGIDAVLEHGNNIRDPLASPHPWYVLIELSSQAESGLRQTMEDLLAEAAEKGFVDDATIAENLEQAKSFWYIREFFGEVQRRMGASIKHDISVPVSAVPAFIAEANAAVTKLIPGCRPLPFGHAGDGNVHYNVSQPVGADKAAFLARWNEVNAAVFAVVKKHGGSISAEHGVGVMKRDILPDYKDKTAIELMRTLKRTLDPNNILNPGKVI
jgi:FAD/FMN-containing dehydrogenase